MALEIAREYRRIVFYNVENLFDTRHDEGKCDEEFTPSGRQYWTHTRYTDKLQKISRAIHAAGEGQFPALVGLCEFPFALSLSSRHRGKMTDKQMEGVLS